MGVVSCGGADWHSVSRFVTLTDRSKLWQKFGRVSWEGFGERLGEGWEELGVLGGAWGRLGGRLGGRLEGGF